MSLEHYLEVLRVAHPHDREQIEAIGSNNAAQANAANNVQVPITHRPVRPQVAPAQEGSPSVSPVSFRRNDFIQFSPLASQKVWESAGQTPTRRHGQDVSTAAKLSPHGRTLARIARGEMSLEDFLASREQEREAS
ncbi:MAG: hypothetical protein AB1758_18350 [Candidatus Eremiobacterota bacterium]